MSDQTLISTTNLIDNARSQGVTIGRGDPREHLSYLSKVGLLPSAKKQRNSSGQIEGHYPMDTINRLTQIEEMKKQGLTFSQMKKIFDNQSPILNPQSSISNPQFPNYTDQFPVPNSQFQQTPQSMTLPFLIIGLILGYLLALSNVSKQTWPTNFNSTAASISAEKSDEIYATLTRVISGDQTKNNQSIYLISVPNSNLKSFGSGKISL